MFWVLSYDMVDGLLTVFPMSESALHVYLLRGYFSYGVHTGGYEATETKLDWRV